MTAETIDAGNADEAPASTLARMGGERGTLASQSALDEPVSTDGSYPAGSGETATKVSAP